MGKWECDYDCEGQVNKNDGELHGMMVCRTVLEALDDATRMRILQWLAQWAQDVRPKTEYPQMQGQLGTQSWRQP
jgi:hypothetical protein